MSSDRPRPPFPRPAELTQQQMAAARTEAERLRHLVREAFAQQRPGSSSYSVKAPDFSETALRIVTDELEAAGWRVTRGSWKDMPGELFIDPA